MDYVFIKFINYVNDYFDCWWDVLLLRFFILRLWCWLRILEYFVFILMVFFGGNDGGCCMLLVEFFGLYCLNFFKVFRCSSLFFFKKGYFIGLGLFGVLDSEFFKCLRLYFRWKFFKVVSVLLYCVFGFDFLKQFEKYLFFKYYELLFFFVCIKWILVIKDD